MFQPFLEAGLRQTMHRLVRPLLSNAVPLALQRRLIRQAYRSSLPPREVRFRQDDLGNVPVIRAQAPATPVGTLLYLHGGGYIIGSARVKQPPISPWREIPPAAVCLWRWPCDCASMAILCHRPLPAFRPGPTFPSSSYTSRNANPFCTPAGPRTPPKCTPATLH